MREHILLKAGDVVLSPSMLQIAMGGFLLPSGKFARLPPNLYKERIIFLENRTLLLAHITHA